MLGPTKCPDTGYMSFGLTNNTDCSLYPSAAMAAKLTAVLLLAYLACLVLQLALAWDANMEHGSLGLEDDIGSKNQATHSHCGPGICCDKHAARLPPKHEVSSGAV